MMKSLILILSLAIVAPLTATAQSATNQDQNYNPLTAAVDQAPYVTTDESNAMDELDPFDPNIDAKLKQMDEQYEKETGLSAHLAPSQDDKVMSTTPSCKRQACPIWAQVVRSQQKMYLYINGKLDSTFATSTGIPGKATPNFDTHPDGRIYDRYTSSKYPGGDYNGLGNMPYAVFIYGGFAIHGTGKSNWPLLGHVASHGCIRIHPDNALRFNRLVRNAGISNVWITVQQ